MSINDSSDPQETSKIFPFLVKKQQPQLSIKIDDADIGSIYMEYGSMVYNHCMKMFGNIEDAQDATHDVFAKIQERKSEGKLHVSYPKEYFSTTAKNMSINKIKRARRELNEIYDIATNRGLSWFKEKGEQGREVWEAGIIDKGYDQIEAEIIVKAILDEQDEITRKIYFYKYHDDLTLKQIGEVLKKSESAVHKKIKKFEEQVRVKMGVVR